jgi:hypothetical protein
MEEINLDSLDMTPSSNFGGGIELLMNDRISKPSNGNENSYVSLEDDLKELDNLGSNAPEIKPIRMNNNFDSNEPIFLGKDTISVDTFNQSKETGFRHLNDINIEKEIKHVEVKSKESLAREKFETLRKLEILEDKGYKLSKHYTADSSLEEMRAELEFISSEREKAGSIQVQGQILKALIGGIEFLNKSYDPFGIDLEGWSDSISDNMDKYDNIFEELHEKYKSSAKMTPELNLIFQLATSGLLVSVGNRVKSSIPGMDQIMRDNPDLAKHFMQAMSKSMENSNSGIGNFMNAFNGNNESSHTHSRMPNPTPQYTNQQQYNNTPLPPRHPQREPPRESHREEMKGPEIKNINNVLSSLGKKINMDENESTVSIDDLDTFTGNNIHIVSSKKGRRKSDKSMALNI